MILSPFTCLIHGGRGLPRPESESFFDAFTHLLLRGGTLRTRGNLRSFFVEFFPSFSASSAAFSNSLRRNRSGSASCRPTFESRRHVSVPMLPSNPSRLRRAGLQACFRACCEASSISRSFIFGRSSRKAVGSASSCLSSGSSVSSAAFSQSASISSIAAASSVAFVFHGSGCGGRKKCHAYDKENSQHEGNGTGSGGESWAR